MKNIGVIYTAIGDEYIEMVKRSIQSLRNFCDVPVSVYTCHKNISIEFGQFKNIKEINMYDCYSHLIEALGGDSNHIISRRMKIHSCLMCDYEKFLYLDVDTLVMSSINDFYDHEMTGTFFLTQQPILDYNFDKESLRPKPTNFANPVYGESYNTGVFGVYKSADTDYFLQTWLSTLIQRQLDVEIENKWMRFSDQEALHFALGNFQFNCNFEILNNEIWNATDVIWPWLLKVKKIEKTKIIHSQLVNHINMSDRSFSTIPLDYLIEYPNYIYK